jgi:TatA/E family protein of Tat protein translocase
MFGIGGWEMVLIAVVALLVFGPKRLPELARTLGRGLAEFRRASSDLRRSFDLDLDPTRTPAPRPETQPPAQAGDPGLLPPHLRADPHAPDPPATAGKTGDDAKTSAAAAPAEAHREAPNERVD